MMFAHGFGCDQSMWRLVAPAFERDHRVVLFDFIGHGGSDRAAYDPKRYGSLAGYAQDILDICADLALRDVTFVGHSVSGMIGLLAAKQQPALFRRRTSTMVTIAAGSRAPISRVCSRRSRVTIQRGLRRWRP